MFIYKWPVSGFGLCAAARQFPDLEGQMYEDIEREFPRPEDQSYNTEYRWPKSLHHTRLRADWAERMSNY